MLNLESGFVFAAVLLVSACGSDDGAAGSGKRGDVPANASDCKAAQKIASDCKNEPFDCKTDRFQVECAIKYPKAFCAAGGDYFGCISGAADDYYEDK